MMKKILAILLVLCLALGVAACGTKDSGNTDQPAAQPETTSALKLGMAIDTAVSGENATKDADGSAEADSTVAVVLLDAEGKIVNCVIDIAQTKMAFTAAGAVLEKDAVPMTKLEAGDNYGMKVASPIGKEWYEQSKGFSDYCIGKTADEVAGIAMSDQGVATDETLLATTTIHIGGFINAVVEACKNAKELGSAAGDKLGLAVSTSLSDSTDATADKDGMCYVYSTYCAVTTDASGKVTAAILDASQSKINIDTMGAITSDLSAPVKSKNVLMDEYGMKSASSIGKEWYEQAAGFCEYIKGMTAADIGGIAMSDKGVATDEKLLATTTVHIGGFMAVAAKAVGNAK
ncbi:MAG: hypothetical protein VB021_02775 [Oscillospiraceae bacterium]|nr:hypothetical protein [Oscillospiraceae bacterium]